MKNPVFRRGVSLMLTLTMALSFALTGHATESDGLCEHHPSHTADCGYEATGDCDHVCSTETGCITVPCRHTHDVKCYNTLGKLSCKHQCNEDKLCQIPILKCVHDTHEDCGYSEGKDCAFAVNGCPQCDAIELKGTHIQLLDGTEYTATGSPLEPAVTVMVDRVVLEQGKQYTLVYSNNVEPGTASITVTGILEAGYTGAVTIPFTIHPAKPEFTLIEIKGTDVTIGGTVFPYTGEAIEPAMTVTVEGKELIANQDYRVTYKNNVEPGTATVTVTGIGTASETVGYTGEVSIDFTIVKSQESETPTEPSKPTEPSTPTEPSKPTEPSTPTEPSKPTEPSTPTEPSKPTEPSTPTEPSNPEEDEKFEYKITKGSGSKWRKDSKKNLSFTVNADTDDITAIRIDGKKLDKTHYTLGKDGIVTLKESWLQKQALGTYRITMEFEDGKVDGKFTVAQASDSANPQTGDSIGIWFALMGLSLAGAAALIVLRKKSA